MTQALPSSPELRAIVEPYLRDRRYPATRKLSEDDLNRMSPCVKKKLREFGTLIDKENNTRANASVPTEGSAWAAVREEIRVVLDELLVMKPELIEIEIVQLHAIEKGAIPDPDQEESQMRLFRKPNWDFACWTCGGDVAAVNVSHSVHLRGMRGAGTGEVRNELVLYCPVCETAPSSRGAPVYI